MKKPPKTRDEQKLEITSGLSINPDAITPDMEPSGTYKPLLYCLGEAPGENEDVDGVQFVGTAGRLLRQQFPKWIEKDIRWNNTVRTRPVTEVGANRTPTQEEIDFYLPSLYEDIAATKPKVILATGGIPLSAVLPGIGNITLCRGRRFPARINGHDCWVFPILHPSYIARVQNFRGGDVPGSEQKRFWSVEIQNAIKLAESDLVPKVVDVEEFQSKVSTVSNYSSIEYVEHYLRGLSSGKKPIAFDFETNAVRPYADGARIISMAFSDGQATISFPFMPREPVWNDSQLEKIKGLLLELLRSANTKVAHNLNFELEWLISLFGEQIARQAKWRCTEAESFILDERVGGHDLDFCTRLNLGFSVKSLSDINKKKIDTEPLDKVLLYNALDAKATALLDEVQLVSIQSEGMEQALADQVERIPTLVLAQCRGLLVSPERVKDFSVKLGGQIDEIKSKIQSRPEVSEYKSRFDEDYLPSSVPRTVRLLRDVVGVRSNGEKFSTAKEALRELQHVPMAKLLLELREASKLKGTYIDSMVPGDNVWSDGRIHCIFNSTKTVTGRLSSKGPNMQQWPSRKNKEIRSVILAGEGNTLVACDYCLTGDTRVITIDGIKTIKEVVGNKIPVLSSNGTDIAFRNVTASAVVGVAEVMKMTLEDGTSVTCTPDHKWMSKKGVLTKTSELKSGDRLKHVRVIRCGPKRNYPAWWVRSNRQHFYCHKLTAFFCLGPTPKGQHIDHIDGDPSNWVRENIRFLQAKENLGQGGKRWWANATEEQRQDRLTKIIKGQKENRRSYVGEGNPRFGHRKGPNLTCQCCGKQYYKYPSAKSKFCSRQCSDLWKQSNHKVVSIEPAGYAEVYQITVDEWHTYVLENGLISGNSQIEARCIAMISSDAFLMKATKEGYDIHAEWANRIKDKFPSLYAKRGSDFKKFRSEIKNELVFPLFYGSQPNALAARLEIPESKAKGIYDEFWRMFPGVLRWQKELMQSYRSLWYVQTMNGRRRRAPMSANMVYNSCIQGTSSDLVVDSMNRLSRLALETDQPWLQAVLNIHDDLTFCVPESRLEDALEVIIREMTTFDFPWITLPIEIEASVGPDWGSMRPIGKFQTSPLTARVA